MVFRCHEVTPECVEVYDVSDRIAAIGAGRIEQTGSQNNPSA